LNETYNGGHSKVSLKKESIRLGGTNFDFRRNSAHPSSSSSGASLKLNTTAVLPPTNPISL
jgi:hypothetical protein